MTKLPQVSYPSSSPGYDAPDHGRPAGYADFAIQLGRKADPVQSMRVVLDPLAFRWRKDREALISRHQSGGLALPGDISDHFASDVRKLMDARLATRATELNAGKLELLKRGIQAMVDALEIEPECCGGDLMEVRFPRGECGCGTHEQPATAAGF